MTNSKFWYEVRKKIQEVLEQEKELGIKRDIENEDDDSDDVIPGHGVADSEVNNAAVMLHSITDAIFVSLIMLIAIFTISG